MDNKYYKRFCECKGWEEADREGDYEQNKLYELLEHYPDECPYCHSKLKTRLRGICVKVGIEHELGDSPSCGVGYISLRDLKELLKGEENGI